MSTSSHFHQDSAHHAQSQSRQFFASQVDALATGHHHPRQPYGPRDMPPPAQLDYHQPQPMEINPSSSRILPPPSATSSTWDYSSVMAGEMPPPFGAQGMTRVPQMSQITMDSQARALEQNSIQQWYTDNDGPWLPKTLIDPALRAISQARGHIGNPQPSYDARYRSHNAPDADTLLFHPTPSDSGYGTATRRSVGNASVYSGDMNEREAECQSFIEPVPVDSHLYPGLDGISSTRDVRPIGTWYPIPTIPLAQPSGMICPGCNKSVRTKSELKKHELRHNKPYRCKYPGCTWNQGFSTPNDLDRHMNSKHPVKAKRFRCPVPGCKSKNKSWPRSDNFKSHLKRLHASMCMTEREKDDLVQRAAFIFNPQEEEPPVKEDITSPSADIKDAVSQPVLEYEDIPPSKDEPRESFWGTDPYPGVLDDAEEYFTPDGQQPRHLKPTGPPELPQSNASLETRLPTTFQPLPMEMYSLRATGDSERKLPLEETGSTSMDPKGKDTFSMDSGRSDTAVSRPDTKAARQTIDLASDATSTKVVKPTLACSQTADESAQNEGLQQGLERKHITSMDFAGKPHEDLSPSGAAGAAGGQQQEISTQEKHSPPEKLDPQQLIKQLENLGYKIHIQKNPSVAAKKPRSLVSQHHSPTSGKKGSNQSVCGTCGKYQGRPSELRKHMHRHERPWGCTFRDCAREFGSKNDWKRHENSQHFQHETWRCDEQRPEGGDCAKLSHRSKTFEDHLKTAHEISDEDVIKTKAEKCRIGRNGQTRFWCGFCRKLIDLKKRGYIAWRERFDHIDDHFMGRDGPKRRIQEWVDVDVLVPRGEGHYDHEDSEGSESNENAKSEKAGGSPAEGPAEGPAEASGASSASGEDSITERGKGLKRAKASDDFKDSRPAKRKRKLPAAVDILVYCCECREGPVNQTMNEVCTTCQHHFCTDCIREHRPVINEDNN